MTLNVGAAVNTQEIRELEARIACNIFGLTVELDPETIPRWVGWAVVLGDPTPPIPASTCSRVKQYLCFPADSWTLVVRMRELGFDLKLHVSLSARIWARRGPSSSATGSRAASG